MKINNIIKINFLFIILTLFACESLEDTYKDYSGDGKIKYTGKCKSFTVTAGWKRFVFNWELSPDSNVKEVQIHWSCDNKSGIYTLPVNETSFSTEATFEDVPYTFKCYGVDKEGDLSIPIVEYSRPFTLTHELVLGFPKTINKYIYLGNDETGHDLILFFDLFNTNMKSTTVSYSQSGVEKVMTVTKEMFDKGYYLIDNIDLNKDVVVNRKSQVEGCIDDVVFDPFTLKPDYINFNFDFSQEIKNRYNVEELTPEFINSVRILELDNSLKSVEDVLYFPNLEQVIIGGNRFMVQKSSDVMKLSTLDEKEKSVFALTKVHEKFDAQVTVYNNHYDIVDQLPFATKKGNPILPQLSYFNTEGWSVVSSSKEGDGEDIAEPENILDNDQTTLWHPQQPLSNIIRTHKLTIDMQSEKTISGFKISQPLLNLLVAQIYYSGLISIEVSTDDVIWENALLQIQSTIGMNYGETTIMYTPTPKTVRYIRITITDNYDAKLKRSNTCLGDFMIF